MAVEFDAVSSQGFASGTSFSLSHTITDDTNNCLIVGFSWDLGDITSVKIGGTNLTLWGKDITDLRSSIYYIVGQTGTITVDWVMDTFTRFVAGIRSYKGVHQTTPLTDLQKRADVDATSSTLTVTSESGDMPVDHLGKRQGTEAVTPGAGQTERYDVSSSGGAGSARVRAAGSDEAGAASVVMDWTWGTAADSSQIAGNLEAAAAGGLSIPVAQHHRRIQGVI